MKPRCSATKRDGTPCTLPAHDFNGLCWAHSPEHAERRRRAASRGGKGKQGGRELQDVKRQLQSLADGVRDGELDRADAAVVGQLLNTLLRALETERKWHELRAVEERLAALEEARRSGGSLWRA